MIVGLIIGIICVISISKSVRKKKEEAETLRNEYTHPIHRSIHHIHNTTASSRAQELSEIHPP